MNSIKIKYIFFVGLLSITFVALPLSRRLFNEQLTEPLFTAIKKGDLYAVKNLLNKGANPNAQQRNKAALMAAIAIPVTDVSEGIVAVLLEAGANPNMPDSSLLTPLAFAAYYGKPRVIQLLLKYGATVTADSSLQEVTENKALKEDPYQKLKRERKEIEKEWYLVPREELEDVESSNRGRSWWSYLGY